MKIPKKQRSLFFLVLLLVIFAMIHLYIQNRSIGLQYEYAKQKLKFQEVYDQNRQLNSQAAELGSLDRIEKIAKEKLGMIYPEDIKHIIVSKEAKGQ